MNSNYQVMEAVEPTDLELREAIRSFMDEREGRSGEAMMADFMVMLGRACSRLDEGATEEEAIADLHFHGLEREVAATVVQKAAETVGAHQPLKDGMQGAQTGGDGLTRFAILVIVLLAVVVYVYSAG
ncbi:hypothetical protein [Massilia sp.]|uniref:hypothetical protein n=1 Tax=Massilia sp. TaxID=1882437 RepID=UPI00289E866F|nr:hypothetical protein [Massilia sp.]